MKKEKIVGSGGAQRQDTPPRPRLVFRVGCAGKRDITKYHPGRIRSLIDEVLSCLAGQLVEIAPNTPCSEGKEVPELAKYYDPDQLPLLRLVTGLCEGVDTLAFNAMNELDVPSMDEKGSCLVRDGEPGGRPCLEKENAAVIGFGLQDYLVSRDVDKRKELFAQAQKHAYIVEADGVLKRGDDEPEDAERDKMRRGRGYRAQSELLLRQSDLLIVVVDPKEKGEAGGSLETLHKALAFKLPVVLINPKEESIIVVEPGDYPSDELEKKRETDWRLQLQEIVLQLTADEERGFNVKEDRTARHGLSLLDEYFDDGSTPPSVADGGRKESWAEKLWTWFFKFFKEKKGKRAQLPGGARHFKRWRGRATSLNYHYSGLYRGTFLANCVLAVAAVFLATASLALLGNGQTAIAGEYKALFELAKEGDEGTSGKAHPPGWLHPLLWGLAFAKLVIVFSIYRNTKRAHRECWNDRMVDFRYLAERLRALFFLPEVGSWQPPAAQAPQYASRVVRQSAVDWLFDAISRAVSPGNWGREEEFVVKVPGESKDGKQQEEELRGAARVVRLAPRGGLALVKDEWLSEQHGYHDSEHHNMGKLAHWLEHLGERLNKVVLWVVILDLVILGAEVCGCLPYAWHDPVVLIGPWIVLLAALLPAVVAALNVVRFQSECERLSERSAVLARILGGRKTDKGMVKGGKIQEAENLLSELEEESKHGGQAGRVLHFTENCAEVFVQEVAEWSVLYAKEMVEP